MNKNLTVDEYIQSVHPLAKPKFDELLAYIRSLKTGATEVYAYGILGFIIKKKKFYIGGYKTHIGLYPGPTILDKMGSKIDNLRKAKGTLHLSLKKPLPIDIIHEMIQLSLDLS